MWTHFSLSLVFYDFFAPVLYPQQSNTECGSSILYISAENWAGWCDCSNGTSWLSLLFGSFFSFLSFLFLGVLGLRISYLFLFPHLNSFLVSFLVVDWFWCFWSLGGTNNFWLTGRLVLWLENHPRMVALCFKGGVVASGASATFHLLNILCSFGLAFQKLCQGICWIHCS